MPPLLNFPRNPVSCSLFPIIIYANLCVTSPSPTLIFLFLCYFYLFFIFFTELYFTFPNFLRFFIFSCFSLPLALENYSIAMVTSVHKRGFDCQVYQVNMAATTSETNSSRYPSEKSVKEALDMLKPPGILSKVGFTIFCNIIEHYCLFIQRILSIRILEIIPRASASNRSFFFQAYNQFQLKRYQVCFFYSLHLVYLLCAML